MSLPIEHLAAKEKIFAAFKEFPLFQGLPDEVLVVFFVAAQEEIYRNGQVVMKEGDHGQELFIIGGGTVDVFIHHGESEQTRLAQLHKGDFFGEMCVIEPSLRSATVVVSETAILYSLKSTCLNKVYQVWPEQQSTIMANLARELSKRVQQLDPTYFDRAW
ncbi:MAG: cyclic nucleotide-binding domain-containing protein [Blastochloris sp.]|nr:cyclic nucleotide-binding domain-containing protein [Blastochloris sp.]